MKKWLLFLGIWSVLSGLSPVKDTFVERLPRDFFKAVQAENYPQAWQLLSRQSQQTLLQDILTESQLPQLTPRQLESLIQKNAPVIRTAFWQTLRRELPLTLWLRQKYVIEKQSATQMWVKAIPYQPAYRFLLLKEHHRWKFGLVESLTAVKMKISPP